MRYALSNLGCEHAAISIVLIVLTIVSFNHPFLVLLLASFFVGTMMVMAMGYGKCY